MFRFRIIKVSGHSMEPAIKAGSFVLVSLWPKQYEVGDIVLFTLPGKPQMLKRISSIVDYQYMVTGDNKTDSLEIPPLEKDQITGKVIWK